MNADNLRNEILSLPIADRAELAEALLLSLEPESMGDTLPKWLAEAWDRLQAYSEGKLTSSDYNEALDRVKNSI
ncbi:MAG: addiction module protein [Planctomycetota bacterium]|nr:addiction module protein [Planctomycetota bacterium]